MIVLDTKSDVRAGNGDEGQPPRNHRREQNTYETAPLHVACVASTHAKVDTSGACCGTAAGV